MDLVCATVVKKLHPKERYTAPYIQLPWGYDPTLIGREINIYHAPDGFVIKFKLANDEVAENQSESELKPKSQTDKYYKSAALPTKPLRRHMILSVDSKKDGAPFPHDPRPISDSIS